MKPIPRSVIVISDTHCGCRMGLFPDSEIILDGGVHVLPSLLQHKLWSFWREFWTEWVPEVTKGESYIVVCNGDMLDGVHHGSKTQVSQNFADQQAIALACLEPVVKKAAHYYHIRGTEAHSGQSGEQEELLARSLGARPDSGGNHARWELWIDLHGHLCHFTHHVGTTGSSAYESTAVYKELVESYVEAGRWGDRPPQVIVRSHRHRYFKTSIQSERGEAMALVTPGWQLKTPFTYKIAGARQAQPQIGGIMVRAGEGTLYSMSKVWHIERPAPEVYV